MTIKWSKFMGGYARITLAADDADGHNLSSLSPRFLRVCVTGGILNGASGANRHIRLPAADELPLIPGAPIFTVWNEGYFNLDIRSRGGGLVGCLIGNHGGSLGGRGSIFLVSNDDTQVKSWRMASSNTPVCGGHPATASNTCTTTGGGGGTTASGGESTGPVITDNASITIGPPGTGSTGVTFFHGSRQEPLPFPSHPEIPMPVPVPARMMMEEGI